MLENKVFTHKNILDEYSDETKRRMIDLLKQGAQHVRQREWHQLI